MGNQTTKRLAKIFLSAAVIAAPMAAMFVALAPARALSIQAFDNMSQDKEVAFLRKFVEKISKDAQEQDPALAKQIRDYFYTKSTSSGLDEGVVEFMALKNAVQVAGIKGEMDPSKVAIEDLLVKAVENGLNVSVDFNDTTRKFVVTRNAVAAATTEPTTQPTTQP